jgi:hypothetical protein
MSNADLAFRPLLAGTGILNARVNEPGTLGYIAADDVGELWIVSAYHVLCNAGLVAYASDETIYQPAAVAPENRIATTRAARANADLDCAAAQLDAGITGLNYQLGIGPASNPIEPAVGMKVIKSGAASGVTEGIIVAVSGTDVVIQIDPTYPTDFVLSLPGDSGAAWLEQQSRSLVALHSGRQSPRRAAAVSLTAVLAALRLKPLSL